MGIGDALDGQGDAGNALDIEVGIFEPAPDDGHAFADQFVARHGQRVQPALFLGNDLCRHSR